MATRRLCLKRSCAIPVQVVAIPELPLHGFLISTEGRSRTDTVSPPPDFESGASTSSATPACGGKYNGVAKGEESGLCYLNPLSLTILTVMLKSDFCYELPPELI